MGGVLLIYIRAHETRLHSPLDKALDILLLDLEGAHLIIVVLAGVVFLEIIDQLLKSLDSIVVRIFCSMRETLVLKSCSMSSSLEAK